METKIIHGLAEETGEAGSVAYSWNAFLISEVALSRLVIKSLTSRSEMSSDRDNRDRRV